VNRYGRAFVRLAHGALIAYAIVGLAGIALTIYVVVMGITG
jgi:hypothetical protein